MPAEDTSSVIGEANTSDASKVSNGMETSEVPKVEDQPTNSTLEQGTAKVTTEAKKAEEEAKKGEEEEEQEREDLVRLEKMPR